MSSSEKRLTLAAPAQLGAVEVLPMDWSKCCLCQKPGGKLTCPAKNPVDSLKNKGYFSISSSLQNLQVFENYYLPSGFKISALDSGGGIANTLVNNEAKWHQNCYSMFFPPKLSAIINGLEAVKAPDPVSKESDEDVRAPFSSPVTRSTNPLPNLKEDVCFLCRDPGSRNNQLHRASTTDIFEHVKACARTIGDTLLTAITEEGDFVAQEAKYHLICLARLYNKARRVSTGEKNQDSAVICEGIAFADLLLYMQEKLIALGKTCVFRMGELMKMYKTRLAQLLNVTNETIPYQHNTRIRHKILAHFSQLVATKSGREYSLMHGSANIFPMLDREDEDDDALGFLRFARALRKEIKSSSQVFSGSFERGCEESSVPPALMAAMSTLMYGSPVREKCKATRPLLTVYQIILANFKQSMPQGKIVRNDLQHEPPLQMYMGLSTYGRCRSKAVIEDLHASGLSVSSNRVTEVTAQLCHLVVNRAKDEKVLCPSNLRKSLFTVSVIDNIDHKPSSSTATGSFNGTGLSIFQLRQEEEGEIRIFKTAFQDVENRSRSVPLLPDFYALVPDNLFLKTKEPEMSNPTVKDLKEYLSKSSFPMAWNLENLWLSHVHEMISHPDLAALETAGVSWAAFHSRKETINFLPALGALLPLFSEKSTSVGMVMHAMDIAASITNYLNPGQLPVMWGDQPIYACGKLVQLNFPEKYGEDKFVWLMGPFHIEQSFLKVIGSFMEGCGWTKIFSSSGICPEGSAEALLKVVHVVKSRGAHQVTACVLHSLLQDAYERDQPHGLINMESWIKERQQYPTFYFWLCVLNLEVILLTFVRSIRTGDFTLFKESLTNMLPWYFWRNHQNYARNLSINLKDIKELETTAPGVYAEFHKGNFVVRKSKRPFSAIAVDQAHEQHNALIKDEGGAIGLTQDPAALRRWMTAGPEVARLVAEFQADWGLEKAKLIHHEDYPAFQKNFSDKCIALKNAFLEHDNPFDLCVKELIALDSRASVVDDGVKCLYEAKEVGGRGHVQILCSGQTN